jgi:hypothetical protein
MTEPTRYRFAGASGALWLGLGPAPLLTLAGTVTLAVAALYLGAPLAVGVAVLAAGGGAVLVPVGGRGGVDWLPPAIRHTRDRGTGATRWSPSLRGTVGGDTLRLPGSYGRLRLVDVDGVGVVDDPAARASVVVFAVAGADRFALLDPPGQAQLLAGWGDALAALAADADIRRIQWTERAGPEDRDVAGWVTARTLDPAASTVADYTAMVDQVAGVSVRHQVHLAIGYTRRDAASMHPAAHVPEVLRTLLGAGLAARALSLPECADLLRRAHDPTVAVTVPVVGAGQAAPASIRRRWDHVRVDDTVHRGFAFAGWPRIPVGPSWLEPLLLATPEAATRTVSVHLTTVGQGAAVRQARAAHSRTRLDASDRARLGLTDSAAGAASAEEATAAEAELVAGYRLQHISGLVTVAADTLTVLDEACGRVRAAATAARLDLQPCHGQHDLALLAGMPLCRPAGRPR